MTFKDCSIFKHLGDDLNTQINNLEPANKTILSLLNAGFVLEKEPFFRGVLETLKKNGYQQLQAKSSIQIAKSARIIGVILFLFRSLIRTEFWKKTKCTALSIITLQYLPSGKLQKEKPSSRETLACIPQISVS